MNGEPIFDQNAWRHFQALERELSNPKVVRCPADPGVQQVTSISNLSEDALLAEDGQGRDRIATERNRCGMPTS